MIEKKTLAIGVANQLRRQILRGELMPGTQIKERDQSKKLGVSRTPMREAVRILAEEGLVILRPDRSPIIADPTLKEITDEIDVLASLEELAAELACSRASAEDLAKVRTLHEEMIEKADQLDNIDLFEMDMNFHKAIVDAAGNLSLSRTYKAYLQRMWRIRFMAASRPGNREPTFALHGGILAGLEERDPIQARNFVRQHLSNLVNNIRHKWPDEEMEQ